jgi:hypothetical protein
MNKSPLDNKNFIIVADDFIKVRYLRDSKSGRIIKGQISRVSKQNANYLVRHRIAEII